MSKRTEGSSPGVPSPDMPSLHPSPTSNHLKGSGMPTNEEIITALVAKARTAQKKVENYTQAQIDEVALSVAWQVYKDENIAVCARTAVEETGKGVYEDKLTKHKVKVFGVCRDIKHAKPVGVVGALTPVTNPTATPASNGTGILKGRNAVIFAPHPAAKRSC